jgi:membrane protein
MKKYLDLFKKTFSEFSEDNCARLGASLSYYTLSSLIPLLLVIASVISLFLTSEAGREYQAQIIAYVANAIQNEQFATQLTESLTGAQEGRSSGGIVGALIGFGTLLLAASGVFGELDAAFNIIWDVPKDQQASGIGGFLRTKLTAFALVLSVAFLLLVSTLLTQITGGLTEAFAERLPIPAWLVVLPTYVVNLLIVSFVFALLFKYLPDTQIEWRDVLLGGLITAVLWTVGQALLGVYFRFSSSFSSYGIIGSVLAFLVYVFYSSQILFLGGEFTQVYARTHGSRSEEAMRERGLTPEGVLLAQTAAVSSNRLTRRELEAREQELAAARTRQYAAAATGGIVGLLGGALIAGVGLVGGVARGVARLRGR